MKRTIGVFLGEAERRVGTLRFDSQGARQNSAFESSDEGREVSAISRALEVVRQGSQ
jgi:hypothetical protein